MTSVMPPRAEHVFKLLVTGPYSAGKTSLIRAVSHTPVVATEVDTSGTEAAHKDHTTVAMDFGTYTLQAESGDADVRLLLFGTPGQSRFDFMTDAMKGAVDAVVFVVDADAEATHRDAGESMRRLLADIHVPVVVAVNRCDDTHRAQLLARRLGALASEAAVPAGSATRRGLAAMVGRCTEPASSSPLRSRMAPRSAGIWSAATRWVRPCSR